MYDEVGKMYESRFSYIFPFVHFPFVQFSVKEGTFVVTPLICYKYGIMYIYIYHRPLDIPGPDTTFFRVPHKIIVDST